MSRPSRTDARRVAANARYRLRGTELAIAAFMQNQGLVEARELQRVAAQAAEAFRAVEAMMSNVTGNPNGEDSES